VVRLFRDRPRKPPLINVLKKSPDMIFSKKNRKRGQIVCLGYGGGRGAVASEI
jgi:hypothetical protein